MVLTILQNIKAFTTQILFLHRWICTDLTLKRDATCTSLTIDPANSILNNKMLFKAILAKASILFKCKIIVDDRTRFFIWF